jgi:hypothetical protein
MAIKPPKTLKGWSGAKVALTRPAKNWMAGLPAGATGTVKKGGRGLDFTSDPCSCCGVTVSISRMRPEDFEILQLPEVTG